METNTPETDALFRKLEKILPDQSPFYDMHEHAQKLERKLYEARAEAEAAWPEAQVGGGMGKWPKCPFSWLQ